jgi:hypothetical protein
MGGVGSDTEFWWRNLREKDHLKDLGLEGRIILRWIFWEWDGEAWNGLIWLRIGKVSGLL